MDALAWLIISIVGYSLFGILFIVAIFMFFKMNIPAIIGDLNGRTAAKQIKAIREQNTNTGRKTYQPDAFPLKHGKGTDTTSSRSKKLGQKGNTEQALILSASHLNLSEKTAETSTPKALEAITANQGDSIILSDATELLTQGTELLVEERQSNDNEVLAVEEVAATEVLLANEELSDSTSLLAPDTEVLQEDGTTVLNATAELVDTHQPIPFNIVKDIKIVHTNEVI